MSPRARMFLASAVIGLAVVIAFELPRSAYGQGTPPGYGEPLPGLSAAERALFEEGRRAFLTRLKRPNLGATFNARSCAECHAQPATGGGSATTVVRYGRLDRVTGEFDPLEARGGSLLKLRATEPWCMERIPGEANVKTRRVTFPLWGFGLIEAIPDEQIVDNAKNQPADMRGRVHMVTDVASNTARVGRFGWKAQQATLLAFSGDAARNEMGLTNRLFPTPSAPNGDEALLAQCDAGKHPKDTTGLIDKFTNFMRFLAPPPRTQNTHDIQAGAYNFRAVGCATCHTPSFTTGPSDVAALNQKRVRAFSDFLLHDIGIEDPIVQGEARVHEIRTPPLWGLRWRERPFGRLLHDGSAVTIEEAIGRHGGQATRARNAYENLTPIERGALLEFLRSL